ncbi:precorrin-6y C5,15-methyltransferase (decarboxylating) subunit CbiE [Fodinicurvata sp. EGI_FJ10296]|uniref:precorrin-6y C5,15-methyltransferase (decarboxylating) subunit CbiE n=1 Tax=Fodinicurvata sp. EGI_FJ10296 TaxID=3231908 RepID=UPI0034515A7D
MNSPDMAGLPPNGKAKDSVQAPWLTIVGIGEDGWDGLSPRARAVIADPSAPIFGGDRQLALIPDGIGGERIAWPSPFSDGIRRVLAARPSPVTVLASGDPFWYGVGATLARHVPPDEMTVIPGASSFALAAARMGWPLQSVRCLSVHGRSLERVIPALHDRARLVILSWDGSTPGALGRLLADRGFGASPLTVLECMGGPTERRTTAPAADWAADTALNRPVDALNTITLDCRADETANSIAAAAGRPDAMFEHDGQISKREIRAVILALLAPGRGETLWDIGAGSGAVGIEWMLADAANLTVAVERRAERAERIRRNALAMGVPDLAIEGCDAADFPAFSMTSPDAVFLGGGITGAGMVDRYFAAVKPGGRLVASAVTVESEAVILAAHARLGGTLTRLQVARDDRLGGFTGWTALRPVTLWCTRKPS